MDTPFTPFTPILPPDPRRYGEDSPSITLTVSPDLDKNNARDRQMEEQGEPMEIVTPASLSIEAALGDISIIDVPTPVSPAKEEDQTPMPGGGGERRERRPPRRAIAFNDEPRVVRIHHASAGPPLFDVYRDTPGTLKNMARNAGQGPMLVRRQLSNIARAAPHFSLELSNVGSNGRTTKTIRTSYPEVDDRQLLHGGRCVISFHADLEDLDPPPLGVISIPHELLPSKPATREERTGMLVVDPVYVMPPARHLTLVLPSVHPNTLLDHFVLDLVNEAGQYVVRLAIAKVVLASLMHIHETELKFYDVPVAEGINISVVIYVQRLRNDKKNGRLLASVEQVDWYVPDGLERVRWNTSGRTQATTPPGTVNRRPVPRPPSPPQQPFEVYQDESEGWSDIEGRYLAPHSRVLV
jgi:hypothetical protein